MAAVLERVTIGHVAVMALAAPWAIGGNTEWARLLLSGWGSLALAITMMAACLRPDCSTRRTLGWLVPLILFDVFAAISVFNPSYRLVADGAWSGFVQNSGPLRWPHLPSTARPDLTVQSLWFFNAAYLSAFNLALVVRRRRAMRRLLALLVMNGLALAVFGSIQKLMGAKGLYFGAMSTVQPYFFGPFIYHNHWGAFTLLMLAASLALLFHFSRRRTARDFWHSPALAILVCVAFLATTIPLSRSRSSSVLALFLLGAAGLHGLMASRRRRRRFGEPTAAPLIAFGAGGLLLAGFIYSVARPMIAERLTNTREQWAKIRVEGSATPRAVLYRDTWRLALDRRWFGWGLASYPTAFYPRNTQYYSHDGPHRVFVDAHSDWLQSLAEVGLIGSVLVIACVLIPLTAINRRTVWHPIVLYLLLGCGSVILYASLEFPFGSRAVIVAFWTCFFAGIQYARLSAAVVLPGGA